MGIVNVTKDTGNQFLDNDRVDDMDFTTGLREFKPPYQARMDWRAILAYTVAACVSFVVLWIVYGVWKTIHCWGLNNYVTCQTLSQVEPLVFGSVFFLGIALIVWNCAARIAAFTRQQIAISNRTNLVLDRFGDQQPANLFDRLDPAELTTFVLNRYQIANQLEHDIAPFKIYRGVNSLSLNSSNAAPMLPELAEADPMITPIEPSVWLEWINRQPHVILAGATGKGKTVTAKPIIAPRIDNGEQLMIIDPHADHWFGLDVIGGGENWLEIKAAIEQIAAEYNARQEAREIYRRTKHASMPVNAFKRLTVVMDEAFLISLHTNTAPRGTISAWDQFCEVLGSGARKINISIVMLSQTANVEDLGLSGPLRENFTRICVDDRSIKLMIRHEETNAERKQLLYEALIGMPYPATTVVGTSVELLSRDGLDRIPDPHVQPSNNWSFVRSQVATNGQNGHARTNEPNMIAQLRALRLSGVTRDQARFDYGLHFTDSDWTAAQ